MYNKPEIFVLFAKLLKMVHSFSITNKNPVKRPISNTCFYFIFGSTVFKLENIKVCYWGMNRICKGLGKSMSLMFQYFRLFVIWGSLGICICLLNNNIFTFHDLFTFTESIDN